MTSDDEINLAKIEYNTARKKILDFRQKIVCLLIRAFDREHLSSSGIYRKMKFYTLYILQ
jgi:hypothetical protein